MRTTTFTCDNCHQSIDDAGDGDLFFVSVQRFGASGVQRHADFCATCAAALPAAVRPEAKEATS